MTTVQVEIRTVMNDNLVATYQVEVGETETYTAKGYQAFIEAVGYDPIEVRHRYYVARP